MPKKVSVPAQPDPIVNLNDLYRVRLTRLCMILEKKITQDNSDEELSKEEKTDGYKNLGYFSTWDYLGTILSRDIQRDKALKKGEISADEFLKNLKETYAEIQKIFKSIDKTTSNKK